MGLDGPPSAVPGEAAEGVRCLRQVDAYSPSTRLFKNATAMIAAR